MASNDDAIEAQHEHKLSSFLERGPKLSPRADERTRPLRVNKPTQAAVPLPVEAPAVEKRGLSARPSQDKPHRSTRVETRRRREKRAQQTPKQRKRRVGRERSVKIGIWATPVTKAMADELSAKRGISVADLFEILIREASSQ